MSKFSFYFMLIITIAMIVSDCKAQEPIYRVTWSNEIIMPFEDIDFPNLSNNGKKLVFIRYKDTGMPPNLGEIWMSNSNGTEATLLFSEKGLNITSPIWFPSGDKIAFLKRSNYEMWVIYADGKVEGPIAEKEYEKISPVFTPDGTKLLLGLLGIDPPGIYAIDLITKTQDLVFSTKEFAYVSVPFTVSPDSKTIVLLNGQELLFINLDGTIKEKKTIKTLLTHGEEPIWTPDGKYIILGNLLYVLATGEEVPFLPDEVVKYKEAGKPDLVGPSSITLSKDGKKIAFVMEEPNTKTYKARIKIMDLVWK